jgi:hypothetical protein
MLVFDGWHRCSHRLCIGMLLLRFRSSVLGVCVCRPLGWYPSRGSLLFSGSSLSSVVVALAAWVTLFSQTKFLLSFGLCLCFVFCFILMKYMPMHVLEKSCIRPKVVEHFSRPCVKGSQTKFLLIFGLCLYFVFCFLLTKYMPRHVLEKSCIRPKVVKPFSRPCVKGSYVHWVALFIYT